MSRTTQEHFEELGRALSDLRASVWQERYYFLAVFGTLWVGCVLWAFARHG